MKWNTVIAMAVLGVLGGTLTGATGAQESSKGGAAFCVVQTGSGGRQTQGCDMDSVRRLAQAGHVYEENQMGMASALVVGDGGADQARRWFEKAAHRGYAPAQVNLAVMYVYGWGVEKNYGKALYWLDSAATKGNSRASANLGILYLNGWGVRQDYAEARKLFEKAAEAGDTAAMVNLGYLHDAGLGMEQDHAAGAAWYRKAADRGEALGQNDLADLYLRGEGVAQNDAEAFELFQKAAQQGNTAARIKLGYMYLSGRGTKKDLSQAYTWIKSASMAGDKRGDEYLAGLERTLGAQGVNEATQRAVGLQSGIANRGVEMAFIP